MIYYRISYLIPTAKKATNFSLGSFILNKLLGSLTTAAALYLALVAAAATQEAVAVQEDPA